MLMRERTEGTVNLPWFGICCKAGLSQVLQIPEEQCISYSQSLDHSPRLKYFRTHVCTTQMDEQPTTEHTELYNALLVN